MRGSLRAASPIHKLLCGRRRVEAALSQNHRAHLFRKYAGKLVENDRLNRSLVSFQANKEIPFYRWYKYKEGFSAPMVRYILEMFQPAPHTTTQKG
jgi:hypothetical protein